MKKYIALCAIFLYGGCQVDVFGWGFYGHYMINRMAIFSLPPEMFGFYKLHHQYLIENSVNPDKRRYAVVGEAPRHFIDLDVYGDSALYKMPRYWQQAIDKYGEDTLMAHGVVPWHIQLMKHQLTEAFNAKDTKKILRLSADMGHYIADAHVPLHTTHNYNGQLTGQRGIHGLWESRLPELYAKNYNFFVGKASYINNTQESAWKAVASAHLALDSVFTFESDVSNRFPDDKKFSFEQRGATIMKVYSEEFSQAYHQMLAGQVERQMRASVKMIADMWYTCWVDAGQPNLDGLKNASFTKKELELIEKENTLPAELEEHH